MEEKEVIAKLLSEATPLNKEEILLILEKPKVAELGDFAFPCFVLAKTLKKNPSQIASDIVKDISSMPNSIEKVKAAGPYINFYLNKTLLAKDVLSEILKQKDKYGSSSKGKGKKIVLDFSSPNIAKPMSIGHLRSTIIGNSLRNIYSFLGYKCIAINFLGDYGTQFGRLIVAYKKWGKSVKAEMKSKPVNALLKLYTRFHEEAVKNKSLEEEARKEFKKLEEGDKSSIALWKQFKELSLKEFKKTYAELGIKFDVYSGESNYRNKTKAIVDELTKRKLAVESDNALIVQLEQYDLSPLLIQKTDGATLYSTRDMAAVKERFEKYKFDKMLYVVASEQNLYFRQLFKTLELLGYDWAKNCKHINFGMIYMEDGKLSTRKGEVIFLDEVIQKIIALSKKFINNKEISKSEQEKIAKAVGISALIYSDLANDRIRDVKFDWDKVLRLEGDSGPYLQYTYARARSILRKSKASVKNAKVNSELISTEEEKTIVKLLSEFPSVVEHAAANDSPHVIANYALKLCDNFNTFYEKNPVLKAEKKVMKLRLALTFAFAQVVKNALSLLGMTVLERM